MRVLSGSRCGKQVASCRVVCLLTSVQSAQDWVATAVIFGIEDATPRLAHARSSPRSFSLRQPGPVTDRRLAPYTAQFIIDPFIIPLGRAAREHSTCGCAGQAVPDLAYSRRHDSVCGLGWPYRSYNVYVREERLADLSCSSNRRRTALASAGRTAATTHAPARNA